MLSNANMACFAANTHPGFDSVQNSDRV